MSLSTRIRTRLRRKRNVVLIRELLGANTAGITHAFTPLIGGVTVAEAGENLRRLSAPAGRAPYESPRIDVGHPGGPSPLDPIALILTTICQDEAVAAIPEMVAREFLLQAGDDFLAMVEQEMAK